MQRIVVLLSLTSLFGVGVGRLEIRAAPTGAAAASCATDATSPTDLPSEGQATAPPDVSFGYLPLVSKALDLGLPRPPVPKATPTVALCYPEGTILTASGPVTGEKDGGAWRFLSIPCAAPPVGNLRWRPPQPPPPWSVPLEALHFGSPCPQYGDDGQVFGDEDCLTLNVWAPVEALEEGERRPVLFFLHGGRARAGLERRDGGRPSALRRQTIR